MLKDVSVDQPRFLGLSFQPVGVFSVIPNAEVLHTPVYCSGRVFSLVGEVLKTPFHHIGELFLKTLSPLDAFREPNLCQDGSQILVKVVLVTPLLALTISSVALALIGNFSSAFGQWLVFSTNVPTRLDKAIYDCRYYTHQRKAHSLSFIDSEKWEKTKVGVALSSYQNAWDELCNLFAFRSDWDMAKVELLQKKDFNRKDTAGFGVDPFRDPAYLLQLTKGLGAEVVRSSIEWSYLISGDGTLNLSEIDKIVSYLREMGKEEKQILLTLHHFVDPIWFSESGAFETRENAQVFVNSIETIFRSLRDKLLELENGEALLKRISFTTFNEPTICGVFSGRIMGNWPPFKRGDFLRAAKVLVNIFWAHNRIYEKIKKIDEEIQVSIVHQALSFIPYRTFDSISGLVAYFLSLFTNIFVSLYLKTGRLDVFFPFLARASLNEPLKTDAFYVNGYVRPPISLIPSFKGEKPTAPPLPGQGDTEMPFAADPFAIASIYKELYKSAQKGGLLSKAKFGITECGIASTDEEGIKDFFIKLIWAFNELLKEGYPIDVITFWSLTDNFEWSEGWTKHFGLMGLNPEEVRADIERLINSVRISFPEMESILNEIFMVSALKGVEPSKEELFSEFLVKDFIEACYSYLGKEPKEGKFFLEVIIKKVARGSLLNIETLLDKNFQNSLFAELQREVPGLEKTKWQEQLNDTLNRVSSLGDFNRRAELFKQALFSRLEENEAPNPNQNDESLVRRLERYMIQKYCEGRNFPTRPETISSAILMQHLSKRVSFELVKELISRKKSS